MSNYADEYEDDGCEICGAPLSGCSDLCGICEASADCGLGPDGQCSKAGSEECDWECPNSHGPRYCGSNAWHLAHQTLPVDGCECADCRAALAKARGEQ